MEKVVLIVEDEPKNLKLFRDLLQARGITTREATDGRQAVESVRSGKPDLILMDIQMPVMDGLEATKILKADPETASIPIIALTAFAMRGDREKAMEAGCDGYIAKPINVRDFLEEVSSFLLGEAE